MPTVHHLLGAVLSWDRTCEPTDGQLLVEYTRRHDAAALESLVRRHGSMVWNVCRRVLGDHHNSEDAFQATFLVFVRKASSITSPELLANWLYGVAHQTALRARATAAKRKSREKQVAELPEPAWIEPNPGHNWQPQLDDELSHLPAIYRIAIILCDLEGQTRRESARQLGVPEGTLAARLSRGRALLAKRLARHGPALSTGSVAALLFQNSASACAPSAMLTSTVEVAAQFAAVSPEVNALTRGVLKAMFMTKCKIAAMALGTAVLLVLAAPGLLAFARQDAERPTAGPVITVKRQDKPEKTGWREVFAAKHEHPVTLVASSADWIAAGDEGGNLYLYDSKTGKNRTIQAKGGKGEGLTTSVDRLQFTLDGKRLFAITNEHRGMCQHNLDPKAEKQGFGYSFDDPIYFGVTADGEFSLQFESAGKRLSLHPWSRSTVDYESILYEAKIVHAAASPDDKWLAVVTADENLRIHDRASLRETQTIPMAKQTVNAIQFSADGKRLAVVGKGAFAKIYDTDNGKEVAAFKGHAGIIYCVAFSPDGKSVVTGGDDNMARIWDAVTAKPLTVLEGHKDSVRSVAFDPAGATLVTGSADKSVKVWRVGK